MSTEEVGKPIGIVEDATKDWSEKDKEWLEKHCPTRLKTIAVRHGRGMFQLVMRAGACTYALSLLAANARNSAVNAPLQMLGKSMDQMCQELIAAKGYTLEQFFECKQDVERVGELLAAGSNPDERISKGGIILDS